MISVLGYLWTAAFAIGWLYMSALMIGTAWSGVFAWEQRRIGKPGWPPRRSENPVKFWLVWCALAWPFLILPMMILVGGLLLLLTGENGS